MNQSKISRIYIFIAILAFIFAGIIISQNFQKTQTPQPSYINTNNQALSPTEANQTYSGSAKGVIGVLNPKPKQTIVSPLTITGIVYIKKGKLTITLKQKESGSIVTEPKTVEIRGNSDRIEFAEAIQFGLPAQPQPGILEVSFQDETGRNADDKVSIEVNFPSDLGKGE